MTSFPAGFWRGGCAGEISGTPYWVPYVRYWGNWGFFFGFSVSVIKEFLNDLGRELGDIFIRVSEKTIGYLPGGKEGRNRCLSRVRPERSATEVSRQAGQGWLQRKNKKPKAPEKMFQLWSVPLPPTKRDRKESKVRTQKCGHLIWGRLVRLWEGWGREEKYIMSLRG